MEVVKRHSLSKEEVDEKKKSFSNLVTQGSQIVPPSLRPYYEKAGPLFTGLCSLYLIMKPLALAAKDLWGMLMAIVPAEVWGIVTGFFLCFYGGNFILIMAAYQAFMLCGWEATKRNLKDLQEEYEKAKEIVDEVLSKDNDGDGVADIDQLNQAQIMLQRFSAFTSACKDPAKISGAVAGIFSAFLGVIATLSFRMAQVSVLGASLGLTIKSTLTPFVRPSLESAVDKKNHHWIDTGISTVCVIVSMNLAFLLQSFMNMLQPAIHGAEMIVTNALVLLNGRGIATSILPKSTTASYIIYGTLVLGLFFQATYSYMPFPLGLICLPAFFAESFLATCVGTSA